MALVALGIGDPNLTFSASFCLPLEQPLGVFGIFKSRVNATNKTQASLMKLSQQKFLAFISFCH